MPPVPLYDVLTPPIAPPPSPAHSTGVKENGFITLYASLSLLGVSVVFLLFYYAVKAYTGLDRRNRQANVNVNSRRTPARNMENSQSPCDRPSGYAGMFAPLWCILPRRTQPAASPRVQDLHDPTIQQWAAAYLRHVRSMEDYQAGMPRVVQTPPPIRTPPPLYSSVYPQASVATIGLAADLKRPLAVCRQVPSRVGTVRASPDPEADIADILECYAMEEESEREDSFSSANGGGPDTSFEDDFFPTIPIIIVDGCEDVVPPPYEEDITDQAFDVYGSKLVDGKKYLSPKYRARDINVATNTQRGRTKTRPAQYLGRSGSIFARLTNCEGFFRIPTLRTKQRSRTDDLGRITE